MDPYPCHSHWKQFSDPITLLQPPDDPEAEVKSVPNSRQNHYLEGKDDGRQSGKKSFNCDLFPKSRASFATGKVSRPKLELLEESLGLLNARINGVMDVYAWKRRYYLGVYGHTMVRRNKSRYS
ncbi:LOW QUALITY PROTEIN: hypothetical protein H112_05754 [Trichophyton rubrum D6]|uniref:Uncharacterized protein n=3 Tax=Trichophyton TaxID=5550 RepID=A0A080WM83_TRIRC|nr:LOW QUALITY PROTEIN: uncharacterized protein TERG_12003 [Trichophyton rubrum CBS 118892]EZF16311.1 LOW QUALITY PROTEIN: hypothetical protein H100_05771 [Trichophyton rubrum MR850]EZF40447.1 LOW QUALITY PROTEIN: hypothetical protein H102_05739 [Trichophyton rubrum CBS 100081]EZF50955.1 LOW QUALITY PROTEIN: hypothetical protein H103_05767 [Trichophyton rubrum CBS 288.86]EZF61670.1 LOW QUALITY PROTEIN: hypothetical protein H104_05751 [Trichophyton rubrum CBS 289.86]EZF72059.1 LOW QUALITY PROTE